MKWNSKCNLYVVTCPWHFNISEFHFTYLQKYFQNLQLQFNILCLIDSWMKLHHRTYLYFWMFFWTPFPGWTWCLAPQAPSLFSYNGEPCRSTFHIFNFLQVWHDFKGWFTTEISQWWINNVFKVKRKRRSTAIEDVVMPYLAHLYVCLWLVSCVCSYDSCCN